ncbi:PA0069 family radical SAM protein [Marilutibacter maris]|uniref:PA0069 family radical SAM protein n=1 Tax=Marilutibacter maris TaxID=1605891 RepID=UPI000DA89AA9|nr:PA0069 family radical SAM protein [Lysobacter maris]
MDDARKIVAPSARQVKGRGAASRIEGRFATTRTEAADDGWDSLAGALADQDEGLRHPATQVREERARSVISRNDSPDIGFSQSVNPYRGCEHGCVYCFARPSHAYLDLSPGLDFETRLFAKTNAAERLRHELSKPSYRCAPIALGINTDAYQPIERDYRITRQCLELLAECRHPVSFVTKGAAILRDLDLLAAMASERLVTVYVSVTTLDNRLSARMEPRAAAPHTRLKAIRALAEAGVPVGVLVAPVIPMINDRELEAILEAAHAAGARSAGHVLLRLPHELKQVWREWLQLHYPDRADHVMSLIRQMRGGKDYDSAFGTRMRGSGPFAELIAQRFRKAQKRLGYGRLPPLDCSRFVAPRRASPQGDLFA